MGLRSTKIGLKIGLLGGSFNPAHAGHLHISEIALKKLGLAQVWWLVSPQNPLKPRTEMMDFEKRFASAVKAKGQNPKIKVSDIEAKFGTRYTVDILRRLKAKFPHYEFVWLMGADNLLQLPKWKNWQEILRLVPIHVFDRAQFFHQAVSSRAYSQYKGRITYHNIRKNPFSATGIRLTKR